VLADSDRIRIRRFVQEGLGCRCPDAVFEHVDVARDGVGALLQLAIGGRLLIRVHQADAAAHLLRDLPRWIAAGVAQRRALGLKRLRLVLAADNPEAVEAPARAVFERACAGVEDVHLHVRRRADLDSALGTQWLAPEPPAAVRRILP
jgi:hypothetical protein